MQGIESSAFVMMILYLVISIAVILYNVYLECAFRYRRLISFKTYKYFQTFYMQKISYLNIGLISFDIFLSILFFALFIGSNVVRLYTIVFIPVDLIMGLFLYYELTRPKYNNENIVTFDSYYRDLFRVEKSKAQLLEKINKVESEFNNLSNELMKTFKEYNTCLPNKNKEAEFEEYIQKCKDEFAQNRGELVDYNKLVIDQFNSALNEYLTSGLESDYEIPEFKTIDIHQMFGYVSTLRQMFETYFDQYTKAKLAQGVLKTPEKMATVFDIAIKFNVKFSDDDILKILKGVNDKISKKEEIALYMLSQNLISEDVFREAVVMRDWAWCLNEDYVFNKSRKRIIELYSDVVAHNAINSCNKLLNMNTIDQTDILTRVLNTATKSNACTQVIKFRIIIRSNDQEFDNPSTMYENMAVSIRNYVIDNPEDDNRYWILGVCQNSSYYENRDRIENVYLRISQKIKEKYDYVNNLLICFYEGDLSKNKYIDNTKITNLYLENILTLNNQSLRVFALLACSLILLVDESDANVKIALDGLQHHKLGREAIEATITDIDAGKYILRELFKTSLDKIIPIVNRVETQRMSLDKLKELIS